MEITLNELVKKPPDPRSVPSLMEEDIQKVSVDDTSCHGRGWGGCPRNFLLSLALGCYKVSFVDLSFPHLLSMISFKDMCILSWNVRGFASKRSNQHMRELIRRYKLDMILVFETHTSFASSARFWDRKGIC